MVYGDTVESTGCWYGDTVDSTGCWCGDTVDSTGCWGIAVTGPTNAAGSIWDMVGGIGINDPANGAGSSWGSRSSHPSDAAGTHPTNAARSCGGSAVIRVTHPPDASTASGVHNASDADDDVRSLRRAGVLADDEPTAATSTVSASDAEASEAAPAASATKARNDDEGNADDPRRLVVSVFTFCVLHCCLKKLVRLNALFFER